MVIQGCEVLLDDIGQLGNLDRPIIEEGFSFGDCLVRWIINTTTTVRKHSRSASLCSFAVVAVMPRPISAALLANSDLLPCGAPSADPFASLRCESDSKAWRCAPTLVEAMRFWAWPRMALNSPVRSWIDGPVMVCE